MKTADSQPKSVFRQYIRISLWIIVVMSLLVLIGMSISNNRSLLNGLIVTVLFSLCSSVAYGLVWQRVAQHSPSALTKFFLAAPAVRMVVAGLVMGAWFYVVRDPSAIKSFALLFVAFYIVLLVFDCIFFARQEKRNKNLKQ